VTIATRAGTQLTHQLFLANRLLLTAQYIRMGLQIAVSTIALMVAESEGHDSPVAERGNLHQVTTHLSC
jgi:hypothetical protein